MMKMNFQNNFSVFDAELFAIHTAVAHIVDSGVPSVVFTDSKSSLKAISSGVSRHPVVLLICHLLLHTDVPVDLVWLPAHIGIDGNHRADAWARRSLAYNLVTPMPISPGTFKNITWKLLRSDWQRSWDNYDKFKFRLELGESVTASRPNRREEISLSRLRTGVTRYTHTDPMLNNTYFPAGPVCDFCNEIMSISHLLVHCLRYLDARRPLLEYLTSHNMRITLYNFIKDDEEIVELLIAYLRETGLLSLL